jgi:hypothetical protein
MGVSFPAVQLQARGQGHAHKEIICDSGRQFLGYLQHIGLEKGL